MTKAFDIMQRGTLLADLDKILSPDELHIIKILIADAQLTVRIGDSHGEPINTNIGTSLPLPG